MTDFFHSALTADAYMPPDENQYNYDDDIEEEPFYEEPEAEETTQATTAPPTEATTQATTAPQTEATTQPTTAPTQPTTVVATTIQPSTAPPAGTGSTNALTNALFVVVPLVVAALAVLVGVVVIRKRKRAAERHDAQS